MMSNRKNEIFKYPAKKFQLHGPHSRDGAPRNTITTAFQSFVIASGKLHTGLTGQHAHAALIKKRRTLYGRILSPKHVLMMKRTRIPGDL